MKAKRRKLLRLVKTPAGRSTKVATASNNENGESAATKRREPARRRVDRMAAELSRRPTGGLYPLDAPEMPAPGPDLLAYAQSLGELAVIEGKGRNAALKNVGETLPTIYRRLLYSFGDVSVPLKHKGKRKNLAVVSGHVWGDPHGKCRGPVPTSVMIIGKMLGSEENTHGRNMIGKSGQLFLDACQDMGLSVGGWYVTNLMKTLHPEAESGGTRLTAAMIREWLPLLHQEIRLVQPKYILCLGADASSALLEYENGVKKKGAIRASISNMQGRIVEWQYSISHTREEKLQYKTALVMAITHPAAVLHAPDQEDIFLNGVARFGQMVAGLRWDKEEEGLDHRTISSLDELKDLYYEIKGDCENNLVAIDAEWHGEHPQNEGSYLRTIQISWKHKAAACITIRGQGGAWVFEGGTQKDIAKWFVRICRGRQIAGHFLSSDLEWLIDFGIDLRDDFLVPDNWPDYMRDFLAGKPLGFDTGLAGHAVAETDDFSLTSMALRNTTAPRYDVDLVAWKHAYCNEHKIKQKDLDGFGECPDDTLVPYGIYDADVTRRIVVTLVKRLLKDRFNNNCWEAFWMNMRAQPAVLEMNCNGVLIDRERLDRLTEIYMSARAKLESTVRTWARWPDMNLNSVFQVREFLYGERFNGHEHPEGTPPIRKRPKDARSLKLTPILTTDKRPMRWSDVVRLGLQDQKMPSTGKMTLSILAQENQSVRRWHPGKLEDINYDFSKHITWIRDYRFISQVLKSMLRTPKVGLLGDSDTEDFIRTPDGFYVYPGGLPAAICSDERVRTHFYQTKDTGRWASARPPLQNLTKRREVDYRRILGDTYKWPLRSIIMAKPGHLLLEADITGAELAGMAIMSGDKQMIAHVQRNILPESDPNYYDIHSHVAVLAFNLDCEPSKGGLYEIGMGHMRLVAKAVIFGVAYGRGAKAVALAAKEEKVNITVEEAQQVINTIFRMYSDLVPFFAACRARAKNPRWICGCFGRFRRFSMAREWSVIGDMERQAMNVVIQGLVADLMSRAVDHLFHYREEHSDVDYAMLLQIHDAVILEVPYAHVPRVIDEVIPECMVNRVPIYPTTLDGVPTGKGPYWLGVSVDPYHRWSESMDPGDCLKVGLDPKYAHWTETSRGYSHPEKLGKLWVGDAKGGKLISV